MFLHVTVYSKIGYHFQGQGQGQGWNQMPAAVSELETRCDKWKGDRKYFKFKRKWWAWGGGGEIAVRSSGFLLLPLGVNPFSHVPVSDWLLPLDWPTLWSPASIPLLTADLDIFVVETVILVCHFIVFQEQRVNQAACFDLLRPPAPFTRKPNVTTKFHFLLYFL
jgi:hypothetical protein